MFRRLIVMMFGLFTLGAQGAFPGLSLANLNSGQAIQVRQWNANLGKGSLSLSEGYALPLLEGSQPLGFYFQGKGELVYLLDQDDEAAVVRYNLDKNTKAKLERDGKQWVVKLPLRELTLFKVNLDLPALLGNPAQDHNQELLSAFNLFRNTALRPGGLNRANALLAAREHEGKPAAFAVDLLGAQGAWQLIRDAVFTQHESLNFLRTRSTREGGGDIQDVVVTSVSESPTTGSFRTPLRHPLALTHLDLDMTCGPDDAVRYTALETLVPRVSGMKLLNLGLYSERHEVSPAGRVMSRPVLVKGVFLEGTALPFDHREHELMVALPAPTVVGQPLKLRFEVEGNFLIRPDGDNRWELGLEPWFPTPAFTSQAFTVHAKVRVPKPFVPLMGGETLARREEGDLNFLETRFTRPVDGFVVTAGHYKVTEEVRDKLTLRIANYARAGANDKKLLNLAFDIIKFYEGFLGPFPFPEFNIVQRNTWGEGQAPAGFLFITNEAFNPNLTLVNQLFSRGINHRFAHEIAHQYWGNNVMIASEAENWISEAFSHYSSALFIRAGKGKSDFNLLMQDMYREAKGQAEWATIPTAHRARNASDRWSAFRIYQSLVYCKGAALVHAIHQEIGEPAFATFMKSFQTSLRGRFGTSQDVINLLKLIAKKDYSPFFETHFWALGMPEYRPMP